MELLRRMDDTAWVVVSDAGGSTNPHLRSIPDMYEAMGNFRSRLEAKAGTVVVFDAPNSSTSASRKLDDKSSLDFHLAAGTASMLLRLLQGDAEVPQLLDTSRLFFGTRFEGVPGKIACLTESLHDTANDQDNRPLFVYNTPNCYEPPIRYPVWSDTNGIDPQPILRHVEQLMVHNKSLAGIDRHFGREILYVVNNTGVYGSPVHRDRYRVNPTEWFLADAWKLLHQTDTSRWTHLRNAISTTGFGYFGWYGDWKGCNYQNGVDGKGSVPLLTTCAATACGHSFPSPAYMTIINAQPDPLHFLQLLGQFTKDYPENQQQNRVVWRGGLTENNVTIVRDSVRWRLVKLVHESNEADKALFDAGLTGIPEFITAQIDISADEVGGALPGIPSMLDFQQYSAVLDMDGNSWSSRFSTLLCFNSVAIKVEPAYADHFYYDLIPWKHYVPVKFDLSDLLENVRYILEHEDDRRNMIAAANQWCTDRLTRTALLEDQLTIWDQYIAKMGDGADWESTLRKVEHQMLLLDSEPTARQ